MLTEEQINTINKIDSKISNPLHGGIKTNYWYQEVDQSFSKFRECIKDLTQLEEICEKTFEQAVWVYDILMNLAQFLQTLSHISGAEKYYDIAFDLVKKGKLLDARAYSVIIKKTTMIAHYEYDQGLNELRFNSRLDSAENHIKKATMLFLKLAHCGYKQYYKLNISCWKIKGDIYKKKIELFKEDNNIVKAKEMEIECKNAYKFHDYLIKYVKEKYDI